VLLLTPEAEARLEQNRNPNLFIAIVDNANWLWEYATKQFTPDKIGRITKALRKLDNLYFVPNKMSPSDYNTAPTHFPHILR